MVPVRSLALVVVLAACGGGAQPRLTASPPTVPPAPALADMTGVAIATTQPADGNRWYRGKGGMTHGEPVRVEVPGAPRWVGGVLDGETIRLGVVLEDGSVHEIRGDRSGMATVAVASDAVDPDFPVSFTFSTEGVAIGGHVAVVDNRLVGVHADALMIAGAGPPLVVPLPTLSDGKPAVSGHSGRIAVLTDPTDRYRHAVLGDAIEAASLTIVETTDLEPVLTTVRFPGELVAEATSPMWVDAGGEDAVLVTLSDVGVGARLAMFARDGQPIAEGDPIGQGNRWRHQIGAGPVGPNGEYEIVEVITPHIGGMTTFHRLVDGQLEPQASVSGLTSHGIGSRNLDWMALVDADGDGQTEVVGPSQDRRSIGAIARSANGATIEWAIPLPDRLTTNLAVIGDDHEAWIAVGTADGSILVWAPPG